MKTEQWQGADLAEAEGVLVMLHGRGAAADDILRVYAELDLPTWAAVAPNAPGNTWYPYSFMASMESNQPHLDAALQLVDDMVGDLGSQGVPADKIALLGFSQGACLTLEYAIRNPRRYAAVIGLTGGFIGPPGMTRSDSGSFAHTPVFLGANDPDPHVPFARVQETEQLLLSMQADVVVRRYPGLPHAVNADELNVCRDLLRKGKWNPQGERNQP